MVYSSQWCAKLGHFADSEPVCSVKGELGGLTATQPHLGKSGQLAAQLKRGAGVLTEDATTWMMSVCGYESLWAYAAW